MRCDVPRLMIAAPASGAGKTTVTCALLYAMKSRGKNTAAFKCGPDFIDTMFHTEVLGVPSSNLDLFLTGEEVCKYILCKNAENVDVALIEGVMGYYDGLGTDTLYSSYHVARVTDTPVVLTVNCKGASLTLAALVNGIAKFRADSGVKGVILNNASEKTFPMYKEIIERETGVAALGYLPDLPDCRFESRHLGLVTAAETNDIEAKLRKLSDAAAKTIDFDKLFAIACEAPTLTCGGLNINGKFSVTVAVARDKAFCFYYKDALELLSAMGAKLVYFSPLADAKIPDCDGIIIGGGYPELHFEELSANESMLADIKDKIAGGIPYLAEGGGFMYLLDRARGQDGAGYRMAGVISGETFMTKKLSRFGYVSLTAKRDNILCREGGVINAHEFHYSEATDPGRDFTAKKAAPGGVSWDCVFADKGRFAGYPHIHLLGNIECAESFLRVCRDRREKQTGGSDCAGV